MVHIPDPGNQTCWYILVIFLVVLRIHVSLDEFFGKQVQANPPFDRKKQLFPVRISRRNQSFFDPPDLYPWYQVGVAMDDERQMSTLHPKQRGEHAGASCDS